MTNLINRETFIASGEVITKTFKDGTSISHTPGTVEVTLRGQTKRVEAKMFRDFDIYAYGMVGRYQTGGKVWPASVASRMSGDKLIENAHFGRYDNHPKFRKENNLWFA